MPEKKPDHHVERDLDRKLIREAAKGSAESWAKLVDRHASLVMAILRRYRILDEDRADAFQFAFVELFRHLETLAEVDSLPAWLRVVASRHAAKLRERAERTDATDPEIVADWADDRASIEDLVLQDERDHHVRLSVARLSASCQELIRILFYEDPPRSYLEAAEAMGLAVGSIGVTRQRCLQSLERILRAQGVE